MANRIDTTVKDVQPACLETVTDRSAAQPELEQLAPRHDAVLTICKLGDLPVRDIQGRFGPYVGLNCTRIGHDAEIGPPKRT
jgi:hypothetical protein